MAIIGFRYFWNLFDNTYLLKYSINLWHPHGPLSITFGMVLQSIWKAYTANQNLQIQLNVSTYTYVSFIAQVWNLLVCVNM